MSSDRGCGSTTGLGPIMLDHQRLQQVNGSYHTVQQCLFSSHELLMSLCCLTHVLLAAGYSYCQSIRIPGINQLTPQPQWAYCEIAGDIREIWKEGGETRCLECFWRGGRDKNLSSGGGVNPAVKLTLTTKTCRVLSWHFPSAIRAFISGLPRYILSSNPNRS